MKPLTKKIVILTAIGLAAASIYGYSKIQKIKKIFESLTITPKNLRNVKLSTKSIEFEIDLLIGNPTNEPLQINGYFAGLERINIFYKNKYLGTAKASVSQIDIPAENELLFKNIPIILPTANLLTSISDLVNFSLEHLNVEAVVKIAGKEFYIKN